MKKIVSKHISYLAYFFLILSLALQIEMNATAKEFNESELYATYCTVIDSRTGRVLWEKKGNEQVPMASTTKILTCILILEYGNLNDYAVTSKYATSMPKVHMGARTGEYYLVEDLLFALMLESYNDTAVILAEYLCGDVNEFAKKMNNKAKEIGCDNYNFVTPNGLDATNDLGQHSITSTDLSKVMAYCTTKSPKKEDFIRITSTLSHVVNAYEKTGDEYIKNGHRKECINRNSLLTNPNVVSGKTGFTNKAGYCYVCQTEINNHPVSFSLLACGWPNNKNYKWSDSKKIIDYLSENYKEYEFRYPQLYQEQYPIILNGEKKIGANERLCPRIELGKKSEFFFVNENDKVKYIFQMEKELTAPLLKGDIIGCLDVYINEEKMNTVSLFVTEDVNENKMSLCIKEVFVYFIFNTIRINFF